MKLPTFNTIISHLLAGSLSCAVLVLGLGFLYYPRPEMPPTVAEEWPPELVLDASKLTAKAAVVYDPVSGTVLFAKNAEEPLPLASLTKLMSAETVLARADQTKPITITSRDIASEGDWNFLVGESWSVGELLRLGLVASSNDAIAAAAAALGENPAELMNLEAQTLGLMQSHFLNPTGLDVGPTTAGAYGSALDIAVLAGVFVRNYPELFGATVTPEVTIGSGERTLSAASTAVPLVSIPGLLGAKTGYTDLAGGNLVAAFDIEVGRPLIIAVLGSTREGRFEDVKTIIQALRN